VFLSRIFKFFVIAILVCVFAVTAYAYAAGNTIPTRKAGDGSGSVSSYSIITSSIQYSLNPDNPQTIDSVTFSLNGSPAGSSTVKVQLGGTGTTWYNCSHSGAQVTCGSSGAPLGAPVHPTGNNLRVVIAD